MNSQTRFAKSYFPAFIRLVSTCSLALLVWLVPLHRTLAQTAPEPRHEQLLNGLKILLLHRPADTHVFLKLRIHNGATFDLAGKEGTMSLLGDALFPDPATRDYVTEELGGQLAVTTDYDSINVTLAGRATEFEKLVDLLRGALVNTQLTPEVVTRLRDVRTKTAQEMSLAPSMMADRALATRLFGTYPYGRVSGGTPASLARLERADLMLARERFLNPNNATLVAIGGVEPRRAWRALRQFLGVWRKSDLKVPATFRPPETPDARTLIVDLTGAPDAEVRLAVRGLARADRDAVTARVLAIIARERWLKNSPVLKGRPFFVEHHAYALPGIFRLGASVPANEAAPVLNAARAVLAELAQTPGAATELELAKKEVMAAINQQAGRLEAIANLWLDKETYQHDSATSDELKTLERLTTADVQRVGARLFRAVTIAAVAVGDATQLRDTLARTGEVEVFSANSSSTETKATKPAPVQSEMTLPLKRP